MSDETTLLSELMLHAQLFCSRGSWCQATAEVARTRGTAAEISQCRGALAQLQTRFEDDELSIRSRSVAADFRHLVMGLLWVSFQTGSIVDRRLFRKLIQIESGFTYLLSAHIGGAAETESRQK